MAARSQLRVEGDDDCHAIRHLLIRHGVDYDQRPWPMWFPSIERTGGNDELLRTLELNVRASSRRAVGFVLDANSSLQSRWDAVAAQLGRLDMEVPKEIPHFRHDSPVAECFVKWFRRVFEGVSVRP